MGDVVTVTEGGISIQEKIYRWKINNFDTIREDEVFMQKQQFEFEFKHSNGAKSKWRARLSYDKSKSATKENDDIKRPLRLYFGLMHKPSCLPEINGQDNVSVDSTDGKNFLRGNPRERFNHVAGDEYSWLTVGLNQECKKLQLSDGMLVITFNFKIFTNIEPSVVDVKLVADSADKLRTKQNKRLNRIVGKLENDEKNSDMKIIANDGQEFFAYRWILCEASDVFAAMFRADMTEKETGELELQDISGTTVKLLLHYIYTGNVGKEWSNPENVEEFTYAADKYQMKDLKGFLDANLGKVCTTENSCRLLALANKTSMAKAEADILAFIRQKCTSVDDFFAVTNV